METKKYYGSIFYIDEITRTLSRKYDVKSYRGPFNTLGASEIEGVMGKFMFLAKMCGEFVGVDFEIYMRRFPGEQWYDSLDEDLLPDEDCLELYIMEAKDASSILLLRIEKSNGKRIYFPTEDLVKRMLKGTGFIPIKVFQELQKRRN